MRRWAPILLGLAVLLRPAPGRAAQVDYRPDVPLAGPSQVTYLRDPGGRMDVQAVVAAQGRFQPVRSATVNFGFSTATYWLHLPLDSRATQPTTVYLAVEQPTLDDVRLFVYADGVLQPEERSGDELPAGRRVLEASHPLFPLRLVPGAHYEIYLRVASRMGALVVPMQWQSGADRAAATRASLLLNGAFTGVYFALLIYNLFLFAALRQSAYLWYALAMSCSYLACTALDGFGQWQLYPSLVWPANQGLVLFADCGFFLSILFTRSLLDTASTPWLDRVLLGSMAAPVLAALATGVLPPGGGYPPTLLLMLLMPVVQALAGIVATRQGHPQARFFLLAQCGCWVALLSYALMMTGVMPATTLGRLSIPLGGSAQALLLSLALADRIRALQLAAWRAESATRKVLEARSLELERSVEERTRALDEARRRAEHLATTDAMTGVYNRRGLLPRVQQAISTALAQAAPLSLISFDVDDFKHINDEFGHAEGDRVLCQLVQLTRQLVRSTDLLGRTGGEEFMLMVKAPRDQAAQLAERLRLHVETHLKAGPTHRSVTASFGVTALDQRLTTLEALQLAVDAALYRAKNRGRNRVETYEPGSNETTRSRAIINSAVTDEGASASPATPAAP